MGFAISVYFELKTKTLRKELTLSSTVILVSFAYFKIQLIPAMTPHPPHPAPFLCPSQLMQELTSSKFKSINLDNDSICGGISVAGNGITVFCIQVESAMEETGR
jgi:hypothetical protein